MAKKLDSKKKMEVRGARWLAKHLALCDQPWPENPEVQHTLATGMTNPLIANEEDDEFVSAEEMRDPGEWLAELEETESHEDNKPEITTLTEVSAALDEEEDLSVDEEEEDNEDDTLTTSHSSMQRQPVARARTSRLNNLFRAILAA